MMQRSRLDQVLAAGQVHLVATGVHHKGAKKHGHPSGQRKGKGPTNDRHYAPQEKRDGQKLEFRKEYSPADSTRREFWIKLKAIYPVLKQWSYETLMVNEYLKGSYQKSDGLYYDANTGKHKMAMMEFYNTYLKSPLNPPLTKWPDFYERGMSDLKNLGVFG